MTRAATGTIEVRPANNIYTVLSAVATVVLLIGIIAIVVQSYHVFGDGLFLPTGAAPR